MCIYLKRTDTFLQQKEVECLLNLILHPVSRGKLKKILTLHTINRLLTIKNRTSSLVEK